MLLSLHLTQNYVINGREKTMRLIDADELKKRAVEVCFSEFPDCGEFDAVGISDIDIMPTTDPESLRPTAHWISVKDRLPEKDEYVLCFCNIGDGFQAIFHYGKERKFDGTAVTHWMPLPEPPEVTP